MLKLWFSVPLWTRILAALALGAVAGALFPDIGPIVRPAGDVFLNAMRMLIVPLVVSTLVAGVASIGNLGKLGSLGTTSFVIYVGTTAVAVAIGLGVALVLSPGAGLEFDVLDQAAAPTQPRPSIIDSVVGIVPANPLHAMVNTQMLPIIVFSILLGVGVVMVGKDAALVANVFEAFAKVMLSLTRIVVELAPFGVFALIAWVVSTAGISALLPLGKLVVTVAVACSIHILAFYGGLVRFITRRPLRTFFRGIADAQLVAMGTTSSAAALPVTMACTVEKLGVRPSTASFVLPLGATINMDGTAIYMGVAALFAAELYGVELAAADYGVIIVTATLASIGTASVPAAGLIMLSIVLASVGLPGEAIALVAGVDRVLDMVRTLTNVTGDAVVSLLVDQIAGDEASDVATVASVEWGAEKT